MDQVLRKTKNCAVKEALSCDLVISAYGGGVYTERKNGLLFQAVEFRIAKCGIAAVE